MVLCSSASPTALPLFCMATKQPWLLLLLTIPPSSLTCYTYHPRSPQFPTSSLCASFFSPLPSLYIALSFSDRGLAAGRTPSCLLWPLCCSLHSPPPSLPLARTVGKDYPVSRARAGKISAKKVPGFSSFSRFASMDLSEVLVVAWIHSRDHAKGSQSQHW